jgi:hypothetical protein
MLLINGQSGRRPWSSHEAFFSSFVEKPKVVLFCVVLKLWLKTERIYIIIIFYYSYLLQQRPVIIIVGIKRFGSNETVPEVSHFMHYMKPCVYLCDVLHFASVAVYVLHHVY